MIGSDQTQNTSLYVAYTKIVWWNMESRLGNQQTTAAAVVVSAVAGEGAVWKGQLLDAAVQQHTIYSVFLAVMLLADWR